jgi:nitrate reductase gamma subunit
MLVLLLGVLIFIGGLWMSKWNQGRKGSEAGKNLTGALAVISVLIGVFVAIGGLLMLLRRRSGRPVSDRLRSVSVAESKQNRDRW